MNEHEKYPELVDEDGFEKTTHGDERSIDPEVNKSATAADLLKEEAKRARFDAVNKLADQVGRVLSGEEVPGIVEETVDHDVVEATEEEFIHPDDVKLSNRLKVLMNQSWDAMRTFLTGAPFTVTEVSYVLDPEKVSDILNEELGIEPYQELGISIVCSVRPSSDNDSLDTHIAYFFNGEPFEPVYTVDPADQRILHRFPAGEMPSLLMLLRMAIDHSTATPVFYMPNAMTGPDDDEPSESRPLDIHFYIEAGEYPEYLTPNVYDIPLENGNVVLPTSNFDRAAVVDHGDDPIPEDCLPITCEIRHDDLYLSSDFITLDECSVDKVFLHVTPKLPRVNLHVWIPPIEGVLNDGDIVRYPNFEVNLCDVDRYIVVEPRDDLDMMDEAGQDPIKTSIVLDRKANTIVFPKDDAKLQDLIVHADAEILKRKEAHPEA